MTSKDCEHQRPVIQVACSMWKTVLAKLNGLPMDQNPERWGAHSKKANQYVPPFNSFPTKKRRELLREHFKFMFVRHPLERLVSAHRDKFVEIDKYKTHP